MTSRSALVAAIAVAAAVLAVSGASAGPAQVALMNLAKPQHRGLYGGHHAFMSPFFRAFVHNQRKGFPFPGGKECEEDAHHLCGGILRRCVGRFGCSMQCLTDHAPKLSEKCRKAHPCFVDIDKHCATVSGGANQMMGCLRAHSAELTEECKKFHPCLRPGDHKCHKLDYHGAPAPFVGDIAKFLAKVRSGAFARDHNLMQGEHMRHHHGAFHPGGFQAHRNQDHFRIFNKRKHHFGRHHGGSGAAVRAAHDEMQLVREESRHLAAEERELLDERRELQNERRELSRERRELEHERHGAGAGASASANSASGMLLSPAPSAGGSAWAYGAAGAALLALAAAALAW